MNFTKYVLVRLIAVVLIAAVAAGAIWWLSRTISSSRIEIGSNTEINITPQKISDIKRIGRWEFMRVVDEAIVDTTVHRTLLPDMRLTCIYYGTLSLGIDLSKAGDDWATSVNDTVTVILPEPVLLDEHFIDEARTNVFYESGTWRPSAKNAMYRRAKAMMMSRALTPSNMQQVRQAAERRFSALFRELGAKEVIVRFDH